MIPRIPSERLVSPALRMTMARGALPELPPELLETIGEYVGITFTFRSPLEIFLSGHEQRTGDERFFEWRQPWNTWETLVSSQLTPFQESEAEISFVQLKQQAHETILTETRDHFHRVLEEGLIRRKALKCQIPLMRMPRMEARDGYLYFTFYFDTALECQFWRTQLVNHFMIDSAEVFEFLRVGAPPFLFYVLGAMPYRLFITNLEEEYGRRINLVYGLLQGNIGISRIDLVASEMEEEHVDTPGGCPEWFEDETFTERLVENALKDPRGEDWSPWGWERVEEAFERKYGHLPFSPSEDPAERRNPIDDISVFWAYVIENRLQFSDSIPLLFLK